MDIDALAAQFGSNAKLVDDKTSSGISGIDVHGLAAEFGSNSETKDTGRPSPRIYLGAPHPPQSDINEGKPEYYDSLNVNTEKGGYRILPKTNVGESIQQNFEQGKELAGQAVSDFSEGHPYKAFGRGLLGA